MKKAIFITSLVLAASLATGCGSTSSSSSDKAATTGASTTASTEATTEAASTTAEKTTAASTTEATTEDNASDFEKLRKAAEDAVLNKLGSDYVIKNIEELPHNEDDDVIFLVKAAPKDNDSEIVQYVSDGEDVMTLEEYREKVAGSESEAKWFDKGVYKLTRDGNYAGYYVFYSATEGKVTDGQTGLGFMCEQYDDYIDFHKGAASESEIMNMSRGEDGTIVGVAEGRTWVFELLEGVSPDNFDVAEYESAESSGQNPIMNFIGKYSNGRAVMNVTPSGENGAAVTIEWAGSYKEAAKWTMSGDLTIDGDTITVAYSNCVKQTAEYEDAGAVVSENTEYENGTGTLVFNSDNTCKWTPENEDLGDSDLTFTYVLNE